MAQAERSALILDFDRGVEILRGDAVALQMHARRTRLALESMPDPYAGDDEADACSFLAPAAFFDEVKAIFEPPPSKLVSEVYDF